MITPVLHMSKDLVMVVLVIINTGTLWEKVCSQRKETKSDPSAAKILFAIMCDQKLFYRSVFKKQVLQKYEEEKTLGLRFWLDFLSKEDSCPLVKSKIY